MSTVMNQVFLKRDLVQITEDTELVFRCWHNSCYQIIQLVVLKLRDSKDYREHNDVSDCTFDMLAAATAMSEFHVAVPSGLCLKVSDTTDPTAVHARLRNPELLVAHHLGLDLKKKTDKSIAKSIASKIETVYFDSTRINPDTIAVIDDKRSSKGRLTKKFGRTARYSDFVPGASFIVRTDKPIDNVLIGNVFHWKQIYRCIRIITPHGDPFIHCSTGMCLTVISRHEEPVDERIPECKLVTVTFLLAQGFAEVVGYAPMKIELTFGSGYDTALPFLSVVEHESSAESRDQTLVST